MNNTNHAAVKRPPKASPQPTRSEPYGASPDRDSLDNRALVAYLQGTVGNHTINRLVQRYGNQPSTWLAASRHATGSGQTLLVGATPARHATATVQRAPAAAPDHAPARKNDRNDYIDLLNGFEDLAIAAVNQGGRGLDTVRFGSDLSPAHHYLLEKIQKALILAQEQSPDSRLTAAAMWPPLAAKLRAALAHAKQLGIPDDTLAAIADNLSLVSEKYIHVRHHGPSQVENPDDYADMWKGMQDLLDVALDNLEDRRTWDPSAEDQKDDEQKRNALGAVQFGGHLIQRHRDLLVNLRTALVLAYTESPGSAQAALKQWQSIQGDLRHVMGRFPQFITDERRDYLVTAQDIPEMQQKLNDVGEKLIRGGVYWAAHHEALQHVDLASPDDVFQEKRLKEAAEGFETVDKLAEKAEELTGKKLLDVVLSEHPQFQDKLGTAIFELVKNPSEIIEKYREFKEKGLIEKTVTAAEIAEKTLALRNAFIKVGCEVIKRYADSALEVAVHAGEKEAIKRWWKIADWAGEKLEMVEKVEKVAGVITIAVSAIKIIDDIRQGKWGDALEEAGTTAAGYLANAAVSGSASATGEGGAMMAAGGVAMVAGAVVLTAATVEALFDAAQFIKMCNEANARDAAGDFVYVCTTAAQIEAKDLLADAKLLADPSNAVDRDLIEKNLESDREWWLRHLNDLSNQLKDDMPDKLGGQPELRDALGSEALSILENPGTWASDWQTMAQQIRIVFEGATAMAKYVVKKYSKSDDKAKSEDEDSGNEMEGAGAGSESGGEE